MKNSKVKEFIGTAIGNMISDGIKITIIPEHSFKDPDNVMVAGCFNFQDKAFFSCTGRKDWLEIFVHEYCHYLQWKNGYFKNSDEGLFWGWLDGEEVDRDFLLSSAHFCQKCESDNEKKVVKIIKKYDLPIDINLYIKKANAYILFYNLALKFRKFYSCGKSPYENKKILEKIDGTKIVSGENMKRVPDWFEEIVVKECMDQ